MRLPATIAKAAHLHKHQRVRVSVEDDKVIITPLAAEAKTLEQRLARFDSKRHGGQTMVTAALVGAERW